MKDLWIGIIILFTTCLGQAQTVITVPGKANPWLGGMPTGSTASKCVDSPVDIAPAQSPFEVTTIRLSPGQNLIFSASGAVSHDASSAVPLIPPDGNGAVVIRHGGGAENGIADLVAPLDSLVGVFLGPNAPSLSSAPPALNFSSASSQNFLKLAPALKQPFFIGNGRTSSQQPQVIVVPAGASRLFLGVMDECGWSSNRGSFTAAVSDFAPALSIRVSQVEICWTSVQNVRYQVQFRTAVTADEWVNLGEAVASSDTTNCLTDEVLPGQPQRLYRVVALGQ